MKYLYLDDENTEDTKAYAELLTKKVNDLEIEFRHPKTYAEEITFFRKNNQALDGLILDLRLDMVTNNDVRADYRALTLAQEFRTRVTEGSFKAIPLILCSTDDRLNKSYKKDESGHDLFDVRYLKTDFVRDSLRVANECLDLANGYKEIIAIKGKLNNKGGSLNAFFKLSEDDCKGIDKRLLNYFGTLEGKMPEHEYARLLLKEMILVPSILIDEYYLAARLGIDIQNSPDWDILKQELHQHCGYKGPFATAWPRWWMNLINRWWLKLKNCPAGLPFLNADERVQFLIKTTKFKRLVPILPMKKNYSSKFWTICKGLEVPIDPLDGFVIDGKSPQPWQEREYISLEGALTRAKYQQGVRVHPLEEDRFKEIKRDLKAK